MSSEYMGSECSYEHTLYPHTSQKKNAHINKSHKTREINIKQNYKQMKHIFTLLILTLFSLNASAQKHLVRGQVSDDLGAILGATVIEVDKNDRVIQGSITDFDGNYMLQLSSPNSTIKFSFIGYKTQAVPVNGQTEINIKLESDAKLMSEVVIVGEKSSGSLTGVNTRDQTGASTLIKMDAVEGAAVTSVGDALQGQVAGLDIMSGGSPGSGSSIVIRGLGSLGNSNPLIVVDGIIQKVSTSDIDLGSADAEDIGSLVSIAPEDIKSVRVLKDAAETAVWGTQGANGVLEIETHRGKTGKTRFDITTKKSFSFENDPIPLLNGDEYVMLQQEMWHNAYGVYNIDPEIAYDRDFLDYHNYSQNTDWLEEITRLGEINDFGIKMSGGGDKTKYYTSINYQNNIGTMDNESNKRLTMRINLDYKISDKLSLNSQISYVNIHKEGNWSPLKSNGKVDDNKTARAIAMVKSPNMAIYEYDADGNMTDEYFTPETSYQGSGTTYYNPVAMVNLSTSDRFQDNFQTNFQLKYNANRWLTLKETVSFQFNNSKYQSFIPYNAIGAKWLNPMNNQAKETNTSGMLITTRTMANFTPITNSRHSLSGLLMFETRQNRDESIVTETRNGSSMNIMQPTSSTMVNDIRSGESAVNEVGAMGQVHYKYKDKHIVQLNARVDASSKFGKDYRWGLFPSASYAWRFSDETFLDNATFLGDSKARVSYGKSGSDSGIGSYSRFGIYSAPSGGQYLDIATLMPTQVALQNLRWAQSTQLNAGVDLSFFNYRWTVTAEYYTRETTDVLSPNYKVPSASGYNSIKVYNEGGILNKGWEFNTTFIPIKTKMWNVSFNFNIYANENSYTQLPSNVLTETTDISNGKYPTKAVVGTPVGSFFGFHYEGVYSTKADAQALSSNGSRKYDMNNAPIYMNYNNRYEFEGGDARYQDVNYDGVIDLDDVMYLGSSNPEFAGGFGFNVKYGQLSLNAQFLYRVGYQIVNEAAMKSESMTNKNNQSIAVMRRWRKSGDNFSGMLPRAYYQHPANNLGSDRYVENGDFLKLNNVALNYSFKAKTLKPLGLRSLKMGLQARKLLTFTEYTGQDPEIRLSMDDPLWFGVDNGKTPPSIIVAFNLAVGF